MPLPFLRTSPTLPADLQPSVVVAVVRPSQGSPILPRAFAALLKQLDFPSEAIVAPALAQASDASRAGAILEVPVDETRSVLLLGAGDGSAVALRRAGATLGRTLRSPRESASVCVVGLVARDDVRAFGEGVMLAAYTYAYAKSQAEGANVVLVVPASREDDVRRAVLTGRAVHLARDLANTPSSTKSPAWLADRAVAVAGASGLGVRVRDERELAAEGFGGIVAVGMGSPRPPRLVELTYRPDGASRKRPPHVVLVGKGITFDTGGISLKPSDGMIAMKTDMAGAGAVLAAMSVLRELEVQVRVTGLLACAENMPSGSAMRPSDVITHYGGRTVEVLNTDAEGRLVLADGLAYADLRLSPDYLVDIATLTGAVGIALGRRDAALFSTDDRLASALERAGAASGERVWRMPLVADYVPGLESDVADMANVAGKPTRFSGGSILAGLFLREFAGARSWAHLDIAGTGRADGDADELTKGATGYGVRLLLHWLENLRA